MEPKPLRATKTRAIVVDDRGETPRLFDTIEYEGGLWIVPHWVDAQDLGLTRPYRILRIDRLDGARGATRDDLLKPSTFPDVDREFAFPIPATILEPDFPLEQIRGFFVIEKPDLIFRGGHGVN